MANGSQGRYVQQARGLLGGGEAKCLGQLPQFSARLLVLVVPADERDAGGMPLVDPVAV
ncbi:hypothetical protein HW130_14430 [Streptomyces sp. PKU-EA00015]|uniref:hypothetical protein n=1 Tax=Streptomyces sp. PKU-EA00015 TaxID=2748326 RepID=UPI0015A37F1B|nr:hypothetical protein [Streptomyces sp. PKU-EA00015]NWF27446.1 hypothetical protein [Streptomyces sp. PKU-EA00015]